MRNPRSLPSTERKEKNGQVLILRPVFPRKSNLRSIATCERNMGAHIPLTRLVNVVSMRKMELKNLVSVLLRKVVKKLSREPELCAANQEHREARESIEKIRKKDKKRRYEDSDSNSE